MKIFRCEFKPMWPVGNCLIIAAKDIEEASRIAKKTVIHTHVISVIEVDISQPKVIEYMSGEY